MEKNTSEHLIDLSKELWDKMLSHPFLEQVGRGTIDEHLFNSWLNQDYIFVREALRFLGTLLVRSPHYEVSLKLIDAITSLGKELNIFESYAHKRGITFELEPAPVCRAYVDFLLAAAATKSFEEAFAAYWCAEKAYFDSWTVARGFVEENNPYKTFIDTWTSEDFKHYVLWLETTLNRLTAGMPEKKIKPLEDVFMTTAEYELLFWDIPYGRSI